MLNLIVAGCSSRQAKLCGLLQRAATEEISISCVQDEIQACDLFRKNPCRYDAVFLPTDPASERNGGVCRTVSRIREINPYVQIVLMFSYNYLPSSAADAGNVWLLRCPAESGSLNRLLKNLMEMSESCRRSGSKLLTLRSGRENFFVTPDSILYARKCRRGTSVMTVAGEKIHSVKLDEFQRQLPATFCRCHSSFIVNFRHAVRSGRDFILMDDGERIPVSRAFRKNVEEFIEGLTEMESRKNEKGCEPEEQSEQF